MRWLPLVCVAMLRASAAADGHYASFSIGGGNVGGELDQTIRGAGRLRITSGERERRWATDESFTWDSGIGPMEDRHGIVGYSRGLTRFFKLDSLLLVYVRSSIGVALLDGELVAPTLGGAGGIQIEANRSSYSIAMFVETGYEASYFMPAAIEGRFAYLTTGFSVGLDF